MTAQIIQNDAIKMVNNTAKNNHEKHINDALIFGRDEKIKQGLWDHV